MDQSKDFRLNAWICRPSAWPLYHNQQFCLGVTGLAVHYTNETDFPHRLSWRCLPVWRQRDWHCAEGSGTINSTPKINHSLLAIHTLHPLNLYLFVQVQVEKIRNPEDHIGAVLERAKAEYIQKTYRIPSWSSAEDFLEKLAFRTGKLLKVWPGSRVADKMNCQLGPRGTFVYSLL